MWNRKELKANAKAAFKRNYWYCVLVALILAIATAASAGANNSGQQSGSSSNVSIHIAYNAALIILVVRILLLNPLTVGCKKFFENNAANYASLNDLTVGFTNNYVRNVLSMLLSAIFVALWSLLLIVPGIIKLYSYRMVPYILADNPDIDAKEALNLSSEMMNGHKWNTFVLDLSFIGWYILCVLTLGLLAVFYVNPYVYATEAELYLALRDAQVKE